MSAQEQRTNLSTALHRAMECRIEILVLSHRASKEAGQLAEQAIFRGINLALQASTLHLIRTQ
jgi:hypothetical protein